MFNIYGYISPNQSLGDALIFRSAENPATQQRRSNTLA